MACSPAPGILLDESKVKEKQYSIFCTARSAAFFTLHDFSGCNSMRRIPDKSKDLARIAKCESADDVHKVEEKVLAAEKEFGVEEGRTLLMAALESPKGILNAYEICTASDRMFGVAISGGDFRKSMHVQIQRGGIEMMVARGQMLLAARAAGIQCFDTMFPNIDAKVMKKYQDVLLCPS